jgi:hypothetical protein
MQLINYEIVKHMPEFRISYKPDFRQEIAASWPQSIDDSVARKDWGCCYDFDLSRITEIMLEEISKKLNLRILER